MTKLSGRNAYDNSGNSKTDPTGTTNYTWEFENRRKRESGDEKAGKRGQTGRSLMKGIATQESYYRARYYDPQTGRLISEDPTELDGGDINFYRYASNNSINLIDPFGWSPRGGDNWWGHNDRDFQRWYHRCWKLPGDRDANKGEIIEAYEEWLRRGSPKDGKCWGDPEPKTCPEKQPKYPPVPIPIVGPLLDKLTDPIVGWVDDVLDDLKHIYPPKPRPIRGPVPVPIPILVPVFP
ncbi:MAG TPA: RHS repeat-associated core domain-containing protein [Candidatus Acidoferrum sp.]|nr:RHS repeat-associated core domain-containing protein [Candidatus Acidoferrum sp.]